MDEKKTFDIFDLLSIDYTELAKKLVELKENLSDQYNQFKNKVDEYDYDLDTQEGYEKFIKDAADLRNQIAGSNMIFKDTLLNILDKTVEKAMNNHEVKVRNNKEAKNTVSELVNKEVSRTKEENHGKLNVNGNDEEFAERRPIDWPSAKLTLKQAKNIWKLVNEYMETMIEPYFPDETSNEMFDDMANGLFQFAAWLLYK